MDDNEDQVLSAFSWLAVARIALKESGKESGIISFVCPFCSGSQTTQANQNP